MTHRRSAASDESNINMKVRRRLSPVTIPRPVPTLVSPLPVFSPLFNSYSFVPNTPIAPATTRLPLTFASTIATHHSITPLSCSIPVNLPRAQLRMSNDMEEPIGARTRRKTTKIWKPYVH